MSDQQVDTDQSPATSQIGLHPSPSTSQPSVYPTPPISQSSSQVPSPSRPRDMHYYLTEGLAGAVHRKFVDNRTFAGAIKAQMNALKKIRNGQYLIFSSVTESQLAEIQRLRDTRYKGLRFFYLNEPETLIVKPMTIGGIHEQATSQFARMLLKKAARIGPQLEEDLIDMRGTTYSGSEGRKEADSAFRPESSRPTRAHWPTLVVETGVSQSLGQLQGAARWWLTDSRGNVNIVLLFSIDEENRKILIEQWEGSRPAVTTRSQSNNPTVTPIRTGFFDIPPFNLSETSLIPQVVPPPEPAALAPVDPLEPAAVVPADPAAISEAIKLNFAKLFDRVPLNESEIDIVFTPLDLAQWKHDLWRFEPAIDGTVNPPAVTA